MGYAARQRKLKLVNGGAMDEPKEHDDAKKQVQVSLPQMNAMLLQDALMMSLDDPKKSVQVQAAAACALTRIANALEKASEERRIVVPPGVLQ